MRVSLYRHYICVYMSVITVSSLRATPVAPQSTYSRYLIILVLQDKLIHVQLCSSALALALDPFFHCLCVYVDNTRWQSSGRPAASRQSAAGWVKLFSELHSYGDQPAAAIRFCLLAQTLLSRQSKLNRLVFQIAIFGTVKSYCTLYYKNCTFLSIFF